MTVLLLTLGSYGDVHPFVGLALELRRRGHAVTVATNGHFERLIRGVGVGFVPLGSEQEYHDLTADKDLWSPSRSFKVVFGAVAQLLRRAYDVVAEHVAAHDDAVVIASSLGLAARVARDRLEFPLVTIHLQPSVIRSLVEPARLPGLVMKKWFPMWLKRGIWDGGDKYVLDPVIAPPINALRRELGLPPVKQVLRDWWHSPDLVIGMFPAWYAAPAPDWPRQTRVTHFPLWDESGLAPIAPELDRFLGDGPPPVAFTPGSAMIHGRDFFAAAADACRLLNCRGLLLTRSPDQLPAELPAGVMHVAYSPFTDLLPRCAALVHHGGIGTSAQALRAGIPQLLMPMAHDQPDNALRLQRLGVALSLPPRRFKARNVARALDALLGDATYAQRAREVARNFIGVDGLATTAELIEKFVAAQQSREPRRDPAAFAPGHSPVSSGSGLIP